VEHLTFTFVPGQSPVRPSGWEEGWFGVIVLCTLLGPEGPGTDLRVGGGNFIGPYFGSSFGGWAVWGTARILRTTQWTRASPAAIRTSSGVLFVCW
jgi:hypothetical protein